jgi:hypothetical protein
MQEPIFSLSHETMQSLPTSEPDVSTHSGFLEKELSNGNQPT